MNSPNKQTTILIVEDNLANIEIVINALKGQGFELITARDGEMGLRRAELFRLDLILLDVVLPGIDGFEVCRRLKADDKTKDIPVLFTTAMTNTEDLVKGFQAGAVDYIPKPIQTEELLARVTTHLQLQTQKEQLQRARDELEQRVARRTADLAQANTSLKAEIAERQCAEAKYQDLYDNAPDMFLSIDAATAGILECNKSVINSTGYSKEELIGRPIFEVYHPDCLEKAKEAFRAFITTGKVRDVELQIKRKDGGKIDVSVSASAVRDEAGNIIHSRSVWRDITGRVQAEQALRKSNRNLAEAQRIAHLGSWELDLIKNELKWSDEIYRIFGLEPQEFGASFEAFLDTVHPDDREAVNTAYTDSVQYDTLYDIVHRIIRKSNGEVRYVHEICEHIKDETGQIIRSVGTVHDITEQVKAEEELREHREHLEELVAERTAELAVAKEQAEEAQRAAETARSAAEAANQAKSTFLAHMSHELRTPLNSILGFAHTLQRQSADTETITRLNMIRQSGRHLLTLINDILDLSKIEARKLDLHPTTIHLPSFLETIVNIIQSRIGEKPLVLHYEPDPNLLPGIEADETRLRQVLLNLLGNAVKFTNEGQVTLRVGSKKYEVGSKGEKPLLPTPSNASYSHSLFRFEVEDTGIGISPDKLKAIFQPFEQVGNIAHRVEGTGLGLAISQHLVELMGGSLQVKSELGRGSTFWFEVAFPVVDVSVQETPFIQQKLIGYKGRPRKILVVDDQPENRLVLLDILAPLGFAVTLATNGQEGVAQAREIQPDLILMDLVMPVMTGFEAVQEIRQITELQDTPIFAISASTVETDQVESRRIGCEAFLLKPVLAEKLFGLIETYLELKWTYEAASIEPEEAFLAIPEADIIPPSQAELKVLYELAMFGSMERIEERAIHLVELDETYEPFANKLRDFTNTFEDEQLLAFVEKFMKENQ